MKRLQEMGEWLGEYGKTIYGTRGGPWKPTESLASMRKGNTIYLHLLGWNGKTITLPNIPRTINRSSVLTGGKVRVDPAVTHPPAHGAQLLLPQEASRAKEPQIDCIVKLELDGSAMDLDPL